MAEGTGAEGSTETGETEGQEAQPDISKLQKEAEKWKALARQNEARAKENAEKAKAFDEAQEAGKSEAEKAQSQLAKLQAEASTLARENARLTVAMSKGLTPDQAKRLIGDTIEEMEADADELLKAFGVGEASDEQEEGNGPPGDRPRVTLRSGNGGGRDVSLGSGSTVDMVRRAMEAPARKK